MSEAQSSSGVEVKAEKKKPGFLLSLAIVLAVAVMVFNIVGQGSHYKDFMANAQKSHAIITGKQERIANPKTKRTEYWVSYTYTVDSTRYTVNANIEYEDIWGRLRQGQDTMIYYAKSNPKESYLESVLERRMGIANAVTGNN